MNETQPRTIGKHGKRQWLYPVEVKGRFTTLRNVTAVVLGGLFYAAPWIQVPTTWTSNAEGSTWAPLIQLSFLRGHFILFGQTILIYEVYRFVFLALLLALALFLTAALYGRLWCGYACPQSIFIDRLMRLVEHLIEGPAIHRKRLAKGSLTPKLVLQKTMTQVAFLAISASFAWTLVAIFSGTESALAMNHPSLVVPFVVLTLLAWFDGAYWREQFCIIVCPYARFQGVMQDLATRSIGYDTVRGEPRGRSKGAASSTQGDCIDCGYCVRVCPTGIDIRNGSSQLECIGCAKCADACDSVMDQIGRPKGLIRYDTTERLTTRLANGTLPRRPNLLRLRTGLYACAITGLLGYGTWAFVDHDTLVVRVVHTTRDPFVRTGNTVSNLFTLKVGNQSGSQRDYTIRLVSPPQGIELRSPNRVADVPNGTERSMPVLVSFVPDDIGSTAEERMLTLEVSSEDGIDRVTTRRALVVP
jgi:cytochrome c oxidase accessory protein FixG